MPDVASRRIVFIGDPHARIREDFLRILRFFRFQAEYGTGPLDAAGLAAAIAGRGGLAILSRERVRSELLKLLRAERAVSAVGEISDGGLMQLLIGGVVEIGRLARATRFEAARGHDPDPIRRLAALTVATREDADRLREALRLSNAEHERLLAFAAVLSRLRSIGRPLEPADIRRLVVEHGLAALSDALAAVAGEPRPVLDLGAQQALARFALGDEPAPAFPLRGADLIERGVPAGPQLGALLAQARETWLAAGCPSGEEARADLLASLGRF